MSGRFKVGDKIYEISVSEIPKNSYLSSLISRRYTPTFDSEGNYIISEDPEDIPAFDAVYEFLVNKKFPEPTYWPTLDYLGVNPMSDYEIGLNLEDRMRNAMYLPEFANHPVNTDPHFGLIKLTPEIWNALQINRPNDPNLLFADIPLVKQSWDQVLTSLHELYYLLDSNVFIAGGRVFSALFGTKANDVDLFFHGLTAPEAEQKISRIIERMGHNDQNRAELKELVLQLDNNNPAHNEILREYALPRSLGYSDKISIINDFVRTLRYEDKYNKHKANLEIMLNDLGFTYVKHSRLKHARLNYAFDYGGVMSLKDKETLDRILKRSKDLVLDVIRTKNSLSLNDIQIILRLYRTPSEILHGFDVDSSSVGYDGTDVWLTQRALYAIANGTNTVNFNRMSPSYEYRLAKYGTRGMAVRVPQFNRRNTKLPALEEKFNSELITPRFAVYNEQTRLWERAPGKPYSGYSNLKGEPLKRKKKPPPKGLDLLLYLEYQARKRNYAPATKKAISKLAEESSDYSTKSLKSSHQEGIVSIIEWLLESADQYPQYSSRYLPLLEFVGDTNLRTNNIPLARRMEFISGEVGYSEDFRSLLTDILHILPNIYQGLGIVRPWDIPQHLQWKEIRPGEQMTGTFQKTVLENPAVWYNGDFYHL